MQGRAGTVKRRAAAWRRECVTMAGRRGGVCVRSCWAGRAQRRGSDHMSTSLSSCPATSVLSASSISSTTSFWKPCPEPGRWRRHHLFAHSSHQWQLQFSSLFKSKTVMHKAIRDNTAKLRRFTPLSTDLRYVLTRRQSADAFTTAAARPSAHPFCPRCHHPLRTNAGYALPCTNTPASVLTNSQ